MINKLALTFGVILVLVGVLGFIPGITADGLLLGILHVNILHNITHLVTGLVQENLGGAADRAAVVDYHDGQGRGLRRCPVRRSP